MKKRKWEMRNCVYNVLVFSIHWRGLARAVGAKAHPSIPASILAYIKSEKERATR